MTGQEISLGTVITLTDGRQATVRFIGLTHFANGEWIGVELNDATGKNDGEVQGERYFQCEPGFGMFIRPTAIGTVLQQPSRESKQTARPGSNATTGRQSQAGIAAGVRKPGALPPTTIKRQSTNATGTPTPAPKVAARPSLRSPTKSPTKQLSSSTAPSNRSSIGGAPRTSTVAPNRPRLASTARPSMGQSGSQAATSRASRPSVSGATRTSRPGSQSTVSAAGLSKRPSLRQVASAKASDAGETGTSGPSEGPTDAESLDNEEGSPRNDEPAPTPAPAAAPAPRASRQSMTATRPAASRPGATPATSRQTQNAAAARELEELQTRLRVMEKKRADDREKLKMLEQLQTERDKFESIIQKLQAKYQPQQMEITELRKSLKETQGRLEHLERMEAEHESLMEMATLDREMAEETADAYKHECETIRSKLEELQLEVEVLREENEEFGQVTSPEERSSQGWLQMEKANQRLRDALIRLRDMTQQQESDLKTQIKELEEDLEEYAAVKADYEATKEKLLVAETNVDDLKQQLETALGAEEMIEELADKNMRYQEEINELKAAIDDLEALREISDELESTHIETEKQLQDEIDYRDTLFTEQLRKIAQQDEVIEDLEYTLSRFRELVTNLQADLEDMRASQQITEAEATDLTTRSRAMMDLNMKLQASVSKAQTKSIDVELNRMDAEEAAKHLAIVKLYLPEYYEGERNSVLALLRFKRVSFKANVMNQTVRERIAEQSSISTQEEMLHAHEVSEHLLWISTVCDRFVNYINACSPEDFGNIKVALFEMEPVERTLNFWIENLKKNEVNSKKFAVELQRSIALLSHLTETLLPSTPEMFAEELCMRASMSQSYLDHMAAVVARLRSLVQSKLLVPAEGSEPSEEESFALKQFDSFVSQARGFKVAMGKVYRSLEDLRTRSLALSKEADEPFKKMEASTKQLSELARKICESVIAATSDEGRTEPYSMEELLDSMSQAATAFTQPSDGTAESDDPISLLVNRLRDLSAQIEELDSISGDLSRTAEFEKGPFPWVARSEELKSNKTISPDADEEIRRLKNEVHEVSTALGVKDNTLEEQSIKIELLESRMREASKRAAMVKDLETKIEEIQAVSSELEKTVDMQKKELLTAEAERDEFKARIERMKRISGTAGVSTPGGGIVIDNEASLAAMQENESLRAEVQSLQAAVRFLREENRRANLLDPYSVQRTTDMHAWLDAPLTRTAPTPEQEKIQRTALESRDVLTHLLRLTKDSRVCELKSSMVSSTGDEGTASRTTWRPSKSRLRYQVLQQREHYEHWSEWRDEIVHHEREQDRLAAAKRERALRDRMPKHTHKASVEFPQGLGHGMMGRAWQILGMQNGHRKTPSTSEVGPEGVHIVSSE
ncbi:Dynactin [Penicillium cataractarum]|uniref:Dynactin n=1 Tax=Penicillium cataractarum TaxID=2100454 RepID=A0A9W9SQ75_9EURO|nr:Dynactin [Penicillium cataractarum]KAJ5380473.1 Dynactin [Penicillium cataractarum]